MVADIKAVRLQNLRKLLDQYASGKEFAAAADIAPSQLSQLGVRLTEGEPVRKIGFRLARKIEQNLQLTSGWLDIEEDCPATTHSTDLKEQSIEMIRAIVEGFNELEMSELMVQANIIRRRNLLLSGMNNPEPSGTVYSENKQFIEK